MLGCVWHMHWLALGQCYIDTLSLGRVLESCEFGEHGHLAVSPVQVANRVAVFIGVVVLAVVRMRLLGCLDERKT